MPLTILKPLFLWLGLGASLLVLAIHLLERRKSRIEVAFTNLRLLQEVLARQLPRKRIERVLLLILRMASIAFIFLVLAKPYSSWTGALAQNPNPIFWFVYDLSYSMDLRDATGSSKVSLAKKLSQDLAQTIFKEIPKARVGLLAFSDKIHEDLGLSPSSDFQAVSLALNRLRPFARPTRQRAWVERLTIIAPKEPISGVFVFSDFAQHGFGDLKSKRYHPQLDRTALVFVDLHPKKLMGNRQLNISLEEDKIVADIRCYGLPKLSSEQLFIEDALTNKILATAAINPCQKTNLPLQGLVRNDQESVLRFSLKEDSLPSDDVKFLVVPAKVTREILIVDGEPKARIQESEGFYIRQVFRDLPPPYKWRLLTQNDWEGSSQPQGFLDQVDELWFLHPQKLALNVSAALKNFVKQPTKKLVLSLGPRVDKETLKEILGLDLGEVQKKVLSPIGALRGEFENFELGKIKVERHFSLRSKIIPDKIWLKIDEDPLLFEWLAPKGQARIFVYASTFDLEWGNLPLKGVFYSLIQSLLQQASRPRFKTNISIGKILDLDPELSAEHPRLFGSDSLEIARELKGKTLHFGPLEEPGLYQFVYPQSLLSKAAQRPSRIAAHWPVDFGESNLTLATDKDIASLLGGHVFLRKIAQEDFAKNPSRALSLIRAKEFGRPLLLAALVFLLMESGILIMKRR